MISQPPRVAFFPESFHEVNGVALTSRKLHDFALRHALPFLTVHTSLRTRLSSQGSVWACELSRSPVCFDVEAGLGYDPMFSRHWNRMKQVMLQFQPDLVHITSLGHCGILGATLAHHLGLPIAASWHTNLQQFGAWRFEKSARFLPSGLRKKLSQWIERHTLTGILRFYQIARTLFAPNPELASLLEQRTGRPTFLMQRGIDAELFSSAKRDRKGKTFQLGFVGRLSAEKNVRFLATLEKALLDAGERNFKFVIVGAGSEQPWLEKNLRHADFTGTLHGEALAQAYANFDLFVFPSYSDTFGNVILESLASGVPAVVTSSGGPRFLVQEGFTGFVSRDDQSFVENVLTALRNPTKLAEMRAAARAEACRRSWDAVFSKMYNDYQTCLLPRPTLVPVPQRNYLPGSYAARFTHDRPRTAGMRS